VADVKVGRAGAISVVAALAVSAAAVAGAGAWRVERTDAQALAAQRQTIVELQREVVSLRALDPDWAAVAARVEPSVVTISTDDGLGSGWVVRAGQGGSDILTNYHVIASALDKGTTAVEVTQHDRTMPGEVVRRDAGDDLAVVHVAAKLEPLSVAAGRPKVGMMVMAVGAPLGLSGSVSVGVVAAFRSLYGADYMQFTAPISPGNSGGPVVDGAGRVVGMATAKLVMDGAESLGFAIPVQVPCAQLVRCTLA
jgi:S1-C subfamily serine protease